MTNPTEDQAQVPDSPLQDDVATPAVAGGNGPKRPGDDNPAPGETPE